MSVFRDLVQPYIGGVYYQYIFSPFLPYFYPLNHPVAVPEISGCLLSIVFLCSNIVPHLTWIFKRFAQKSVHKIVRLS